MKRWCALLLIGVLPLIACGPYSFSAAGKASFTSVHVDQFEVLPEKSIEYQLADELTDAVVDAFITDNTVPVIEASRAEALMTGTISSYRRDPHTYDLQDAVAEYVVKVSVHVKVVKNNTADVIWEEDFYAEGIYDANTETEEAEGRQRVISRLAADILDKTTKSW